MDWKKTFNDQETESAAQIPKIPTKREMENYLTQLVTDLNFRLLMEKDKNNWQTTLWVEDLSLISYEKKENKNMLLRQKER